jgi:hypothetical protein
MSTRWTPTAWPLFVVFLLASCGDSTTAPDATFEDISGAYSGTMAGTTQGFDMEADFILTISQDRGDLSGNWTQAGVVTDGFDFWEIQGTGTHSGTIAPGNNPSVNLTVQTASCPNYSAEFSGAYDSSNRRLTIAGPVEILGDDCSVVLSYPMTIILTR